jgi:phosphatidylinositol glycan class A protein
MDTISIILTQVLSRGSIFMNTSLTESFGIAILEAACAGLYVVSTRVGGVPEILPEDMISFAKPEEDGASVFRTPSDFQINHGIADVIRAISEAVKIIQNGKHDPLQAHERIKTFYNWEEVATRTEKVYDTVLRSRQMGLMERIERCVAPRIFFSTCHSLFLPFRTMDLGRFAGPIYTIILLVDCLFFLFLEWWIPREKLHYVHHHWNQQAFKVVRFGFSMLTDSHPCAFSLQMRNGEVR